MTDSTPATAACHCPDCISLDVSSVGGGIDRCASCGTTWPHATPPVTVTVAGLGDSVCPRCASSVFTSLRRCALCGWFIGWGP